MATACLVAVLWVVFLVVLVLGLWWTGEDR